MPSHVDLPVEEIRKLIEEEKLQQRLIAARYGVHIRTIGKFAKRNGMKTQRTGPRSAEGHPNWKGGVIRDKHGYVLVYCPGHPRARSLGKNRTPKYVLQHVLVAEQKLGRALLPKEVVHHRNGIPDDNRPENLEVFSTNAEHLRHELTGRCPKWTPDGLRRIREGVARSHANRRASKCDASQSPQNTDPSLTPRDKADRGL